MTTDPFYWHPYRVDNGVIVWDCVNGDAVTLEAGTYLAQQTYTTPDGTGQAWRTIGRYTTFPHAANALREAAAAATARP